MLERHVAETGERRDHARLAADLASLRIDRSTEAESDGPRDRPRAGARATRNVLLPASFASLLAAGLAIAAPRAAQRLRRASVRTTTIAAARADTREVLLTATGYVVPERIAQVGAKISGRLARVHVREGDRVNEGDVLAEMDDDDTRAALVAATAHANAAAAKAEAARANAAEIAAQARRERSLVMAGASPRSAADDLETRVTTLLATARASDAEARAAGADLAPLRASLADHRIRAPQPGIVLSRPMRPGEIASPGGPPVVTLYDPASIGVDVDVPEARLALVHVGGEVDVALDAYPGRSWRAEVDRIGHHVDRAKGSIPVRLVFAKRADDALPDMSARASFLGPEPERRPAGEAVAKPTVARAAVVERGGSEVVFVVEGGVARAVRVALGAAHGASVELLSGPPAGATVVIAPPPALADGQAIEEEKDR